MDYKPWTWRLPEDYKNSQARMPRQDGHERSSGKATYTRDIYLPGMLYAKILTSPYAHAKIVSMDTSKAEALTGVRDILMFNDPDIALENSTGGYCSSQYNILTLPGTSDFFQHPMGVAVVADNEEICDRALRLIDRRRLARFTGGLLRKIGPRLSGVIALVYRPRFSVKTKLRMYCQP